MMKWLKSATKFHAEEKIMMVTYRTHHEVRTDQGLYDSVYHKGAKSERPRKGGEREREGGVGWKLGNRMMVFHPSVTRNMTGKF